MVARPRRVRRSSSLGRAAAPRLANTRASSCATRPTACSRRARSASSSGVHRSPLLPAFSLRFARRAIEGESVAGHVLDRNGVGGYLSLGDLSEMLGRFFLAGLALIAAWPL